MNHITVVTACRNREHNLKLMHENVKELNNIYEHLIVDWSSDFKINLEKSSLLRIITKEKEKHWWLSRAYNFIFQFVKTNYILKLDTESFIDPKKFNKIDYQKYDLIIFYKQKYNPGNFLVSKKILDDVNGFNEYIFGWGWDDHDLINRIINKINKDRILKLYGYLSEPDSKNIESVEVSKANPKYFSDDRFFYAIKKGFNHANSFISSLNLWSTQPLLYDHFNFEINHFYSVNQLSKIIKLKHKYYFFISFFTVLYPRNKKIAILNCFINCFYSYSKIFKKYGFHLYPIKSI